MAGKNWRWEYVQIQEKLNTLLDIRLSKSITQDEYDKKAYDLKARQHEIDILQKQHTKADEKFAITVSYLLNLSSRAFELFKNSKDEQKRELINFVLWNLKLEKGKLVYELRKPFDAIAEANKCSNWLTKHYTFKTQIDFFYANRQNLMSVCGDYKFIIDIIHSPSNPDLQGVKF